MFAAHLNGYLPVILDSAPALLSQQPAWIRSSSLSKNFCFSGFGAWPFQRGHKHTAFVYPMSSTFFTVGKIFFLPARLFLRRRPVKKGRKHTAFNLLKSSGFFCAKLLLQLPAFWLFGHRLLALFKELPFDKTAPFVRGRC
ncbi:MAG: hypothetical protein IT211_07910 [Armatimonadetes bacterium]|nr:hypothetical protein [Armatimonadota bacterium]